MVNFTGIKLNPVCTCEPYFGADADVFLSPRNLTKLLYAQKMHHVQKKMLVRFTTNLLDPDMISIICFLANYRWMFCSVINMKCEILHKPKSFIIYQEMNQHNVKDNCNSGNYLPYTTLISCKYHWVAVISHSYNNFLRDKQDLKNGKHNTVQAGKS